MDAEYPQPQCSSSWDEIDPYFNNETAPSFFEKSGLIFSSMPLLELKNMGLWNERLENFIPLLPTGAYIAGGFLRAIISNEKHFNADIDLFFNSSRAFNEMINLLKNSHTDILSGYYPQVNLREFGANSKNFRVLNFLTTNQDKPPIQLVKLIWYSSPEHVIDGFDLTVVQFITDGKTLYFNPQAWDDIKTKTLRLHRSQSPINTLNRLLKYEEKGYKVNPEAFKIVADDAAKLLLNSRDSALDDYFYISNGKYEEKIPVAWLGRVWKYLAETENGCKIFAKIFGSKKEA